MFWHESARCLVAWLINAKLGIPLLISILFQSSPTKEAYHRRNSRSKEKLTSSRPASTYGTLRRKVPEARQAHRNIEVESKVRSGLSFKRISIPMQKVPLPKVLFRKNQSGLSLDKEWFFNPIKKQVPAYPTRLELFIGMKFNLCFRSGSKSKLRSTAKLM